MKWWMWLLLAVLLILIILLILWFMRTRKTTPSPLVDDQPLADETPTGRIPALGAADLDTEPDDPPATQSVQQTNADSGKVEPGRFPNSARSLADGSAPSGEFTIKGNADSMLFHTKESPYYTRTKAEVWFRTPEDAEAAGFTGWNKRRAAAKVIAGPYPGSALPVAGGDAPTSDFIVKGNADAMLYHTKESPFFGVTTAEVWFKTTADAEKAGFHAWKS